MNDDTLAAVSTPIRDLRDEVWVRVYVESWNYSRIDCPLEPLHMVANRAADEADDAVSLMPCPAHRRPPPKDE